MKKGKLKLILTWTLCFVFCATIVGVCLWALLKDKPSALSDSEKIERVLSKTGKVIESNNHTFVESFNLAVNANINTESNEEIDSYTQSSDDIYYYT